MNSSWVLRTAAHAAPDAWNSRAAQTHRQPPNLSHKSCLVRGKDHVTLQQSGAVRTRSLAVTGLGLNGYDLHSSPGMWYRDKVRPRLIHKGRGGRTWVLEIQTVTSYFMLIFCEMLCLCVELMCTKILQHTMLRHLHQHHIVHFGNKVPDKAKALRRNCRETKQPERKFPTLPTNLPLVVTWCNSTFGRL